MPNRTTLCTLAAVGGGLALALLGAAPAQAHVEAETDYAVAGELTVVSFVVGHGCSGSPTTSLAISIPAGVEAVTPTAEAGWQVAVADGPDGASSVTYTADTPLEDGLRDSVDVSMLMPFDGQPGDVVAFPTVQQCVEGSSSWADASGDATAAHPAPVVTLQAADAEAEPAAASTAGSDSFARVLGLGGLVVGAFGVAVATIATRRAVKA